MEYSKRENFSKVVDRAMLACRNSGLEKADRFAEVGKTFKMPIGSKIYVKDYVLTLYACCLIV
ncbi:MAG: DNA damage-inducible protein D, partial [Deltaproteobacteria bacterium]|nr:DNA damage-inducible protein D [Deltaproteobacteria bacterium]